MFMIKTDIKAIWLVDDSEIEGIGYQGTLFKVAGKTKNTT